MFDIVDRPLVRERSRFGHRIAVRTEAKGVRVEGLTVCRGIHGLSFDAHILIVAVTKGCVHVVYGCCTQRKACGVRVGGDAVKTETVVFLVVEW